MDDLATALSVQTNVLKELSRLKGKPKSVFLRVLGKTCLSLAKES